METDLDRVIHSKQTLSIDHARYFVCQILRGLSYLHSANVIHQEVKPSNILINSNCEIKIFDMVLQTTEENSYFQNCWYSSPEYLLGQQEINAALDIWGVGCIFAEILLRKPIFPGNSNVQQLRLICDKLGRPQDNELDFIQSVRAKSFLSKLPFSNAVPMRNLFPHFEEEVEALDLLQKMLTFHPSKRIGVKECLDHPFLISLQDSTMGNSADFSYDFKYKDLDILQVKDLLWEEIRELHPQISTTVPIASEFLYCAANDQLELMDRILLRGVNINYRDKVSAKPAEIS